MSKTILITGASSGVGRDTAETLFRAGHIVYASMRGTEGKNREARAKNRRVEVKVFSADQVTASLNGDSTNSASRQQEGKH